MTSALGQRACSPPAEASRLFEAHSEQVFGYCLGRLGSRSDAEDAVQTTFLYALRALDRGVVPQCEPAWLTAIARNVCRWQLRTRNRRGAMVGDRALDRVESVARVDPDDEDLYRALTSALASLPEKQRRALVLREWHGLSSREVAAQLGMSAAATYALLTRARRSLATALTSAAGRTTLGVATLVYELRRALKGPLCGGGAAAKTTATVVAATVTVGGVSAPRILAADEPAEAPSAHVSATEEADTSVSPGHTGSKGASPARLASRGSGASPARTSSLAEQDSATGSGVAPNLSGPAPIALALQSPPSPEAAGVPEEEASASAELAEELLPDLPPPYDVGLPTHVPQAPEPPSMDLWSTNLPVVEDLPGVPPLSDHGLP